MSEAKHRVLVQLKETNEDSAQIKLIGKLSRKFTEVGIYDNHTLLVNGNGDNSNNSNNANGVDVPRALYFDCVGTAEDANMCQEMNSILTSLVVDSRNCCLFRFLNSRESSLQLIDYLLVQQMDAFLKVNNCSLRSMKIEFYDLRGFDVINMLQYTSPFGRTDKVTSNSRRANVQLKSIKDLSKWMNNSYSKLWRKLLGHECLEFQLHFTDDNSSSMRKVKFSLLQVYLHAMKPDDKVSLHSFLENLGLSRRVDHTMLVDFLQEYMVKSRNWRTFLQFNLALENGAIYQDDEMLKLAIAASIGTKMYNAKGNHDLKSNFLDFADPTQIFLMPELNNSSATHRYSFEDVNKPLSHWYKLINERHCLVLKHMSNYYDHVYGEKINQMCGDIKGLIASCDKDIKAGLNMQTSEPNAERDNSRDWQIVQLHYNRYRNALQEFQKLSNEIEELTSSDDLKEFIKVKCYELTKEAFLCKERQLDRCRSRLNDAIKAETASLNTRIRAAQNYGYLSNTMLETVTDKE